MHVILPQQTSTGQIGMAGSAVASKYPALYLLHGWSDDDSIWMRRTSIERYVADMGLVVIMPRVDISYYQNTVDSRRYWDFVAKELPELCQGWFPLRCDRAGRFAAGLSMGGYGAFRLGLQLPEHFAAVGSFSGALDVASLLAAWRQDPQRSSLMRGIFGDLDAIANSEADLLCSLQKLKPSMPKFYQWCGTEDFLLDCNRRFRDAAILAGLDLLSLEGVGDHSWEHWDREIQAFLKWLQPFI